MTQKVRVSNVVDVVSNAVKIRATVAGEISVAIYVASDAPRWLVICVKEAFLPYQAGAKVSVRQIESHAAVDMPSAELALVLVGPKDAGASRTILSLAEAGVSVCVVAETALDVPNIVHGADDEASYENISSTCALERETLLDKLAAWLVDHAPDGVCAAANFPFCRTREVEKLIHSCSVKNALVGTVGLPGKSDILIMANNQIKLALEIAGAHGKTVSPEAGLAIAGTILASFGYRGLARAVTPHVRFGAPAIRALIAYGGSMLTGMAVQEIMDPRAADVVESLTQKALAHAHGVAEKTWQAGELPKLLAPAEQSHAERAEQRTEHGADQCGGTSSAYGSHEDDGYIVIGA
ncbi:MAG: hypothetical protein ACOX4F_05205 [Atopobiaceae bacterium]|jgi:uncharacterized protein (DUF697 family)